jgi:hypothetical protein
MVFAANFKTMNSENFRHAVFMRRVRTQVVVMEVEVNVANSPKLGENANYRFDQHNLFGRCLRFSKN